MAPRLASALCLVLSLPLTLGVLACGDKDGGGADTGSTADGGSGDGGSGDGGQDSGIVYYDNDNDGYTQDVDCDDIDPEVNPGATEICNGKDDDCDDTTNEADWINIGDTTYGSLQAAIDVATIDDVVEVCQGSFSEQLVIDHDLNLISELGAELAIIDGSGSAGSTVTVLGGTVIIQGFSIVGGSGADHEDEGDTQGGGLFVDSSGQTIISESLIYGNSADRGGGIYVSEGSSLRLQYTTVASNTASEGGGISGRTANVTFNSSEVSANEATTQGGGFAGEEVDYVFNSGTVWANVAPRGGGAVMVDDSSLHVTGSDWGEGDDDNTPDDVWTQGGSYVEYGEGSTFSCSPAGCD